MDMNQYLEIFTEETREHLQSLNQCLLQLEKDPGEKSVLNEIFRVAHTIKGMAGTMGFSKMATLTHDMEDVLHALRSGKIMVDSSLVDLLFKCLDALENYMENISDTGHEGVNEYKSIIVALSKALNGDYGNVAVTADAMKVDSLQEKIPDNKNKVLDEYVYNVIIKAVDEGLNAFSIYIELDKGCVLKSARAFIVFQTLERYCEIIKSLPKVEDIEDEKFENSFTVFVVTKHPSEVISKELDSISELQKIEINDISTYEESKETSTDDIQAAIKAVSANIRNSDIPQAENQDNSSKKQKTGKTVRVDIDRLDVLLNLVSELIIQKTRLAGIELVEKPQTFVETVEYLERITSNLHDAVMKVRMVPVETVFNRFPRMIRDIARDIGKDVVLTMSGEETELDRTVIDEIGDPLIHLLRNSIDHGIENAEKRKAAGKAEVGNIYLSAYQDGNNVVIEVRDDGNGIDVEKVKQKALKVGVIDNDLADVISDKEIIDLLFKPSFSTTDKITDLSGRGVGLDVVKTKIEALGGVVDVETELGKGSRFIIRLPLTLAIIQALLVVVGNERYAIQLGAIQQIVNVTTDQIKMIQKQEVFLLRNMMVPIIRLNKILDVPNYEEGQKHMTLVIVKRGDKLSGLLVDKVIGQQEIVQKSLGSYFKGNKLITSATILGDGSVALILDINSIAR